jgi:transcriptional regulator with GAF, ATPase, and Fis domain
LRNTALGGYVMDYQPILKRIEEQKQNESLSEKLFRYTGLIHAIEFFSQRLSTEQIIDSAFDFINELLTLEKSAVFIIQGNNYVLKKFKGNKSEIVSIKSNTKFKNLAIYHGSLLNEKEQLEKYFDKEVLEAYGVHTVIPLIIDSMLYGFIFLSRKNVGEFTYDDNIITDALMKLINNAIENYKKYEEIQKVNRELDEKIFNLFAINQSSKALLSELSLDVLYNLSVDVFSELTQSSITGFVLFDERSERYALKAFKDIFNRNYTIDISLGLNTLARIDINKVIIDIANSNDVSYFNSLFFEEIEVLDPLKVKYIVLLLKGSKILGFVTLGEAVNLNQYRESIFELIESLASATYIALNNAKLFKQVNNQKKTIQGKLDKLISLNNLMKNINSSQDLQTLIEITLKTLEISFDVEKAVISLYNKEKGSLEIKNTLGFNTNITEIELNTDWQKVTEGDTVFQVAEQGTRMYVGQSLLEDLGDVQGILIIPIYIDRMEVELQGAIIVFKYKRSLINDEENILNLETIAGHISPVISNLYTIEQQNRFLLPNFIEIFKKDLKIEVEEAKELDYDLQVIQITNKSGGIFNDNNIISKLKEGFAKVYPFSYNTIFIINNEKEESLSKEILHTMGVNNKNVRILSLRKDFNNFQEFFKLF